jgi:hypothetical protein
MGSRCAANPSYVLLALIPQLECAARRHIGWIVGLLKVSFNMQNLLKEFPSNNKLFGPAVGKTLWHVLNKDALRLQPESWLSDQSRMPFFAVRR